MVVGRTVPLQASVLRRQAALAFCDFATAMRQRARSACIIGGSVASAARASESAPPAPRRCDGSWDRRQRSGAVELSQPGAWVRIARRFGDSFLCPGILVGVHAVFFTPLTASLSTFPTLPDRGSHRPLSWLQHEPRHIPLCPPPARPRIGAFRRGFPTT